MYAYVFFEKASVTRCGKTSRQGGREGLTPGLLQITISENGGTWSFSYLLLLPLQIYTVRKLTMIRHTWSRG